MYALLYTGPVMPDYTDTSLKPVNHKEIDWYLSTRLKGQEFIIYVA